MKSILGYVGDDGRGREPFRLRTTPTGIPCCLIGLCVV